MKLEDVAILEDGNRFVASCKIDVDGHLFSLVLSNTLKQTEIDKSYVAFDNVDNVIEEASQIDQDSRFYDEFLVLQAALTDHITNQDSQIIA